jgi:hypothetical protein
VLLQRNALADEALAMVHEQPQIEFRALQLRRRESVQTFAQRRPRDRDRDRCCRTSRVREHGDASRPSASSSRAGPARHVRSETAPKSPKCAAVLKRPHPFAAELARPQDERGEALGADLDRALAHQFAG